ncbi:pyruvoyl-dependent arginine decarboxylase [Nocardioides flavescens]|uniref:Pyruvoyl-dependent arginine decarboxylase AaxB n=1 Tax=Nocardioides flavescens TaxID=2691959 RepID=A0A6L7F2G3_9ACTN|nr:pyruvoyl-dependent arginine decarboxylase [Nocardioides flavescens]MXG91032.1 hypothetical protein [Nocardioides flavescens]
MSLAPSAQRRDAARPTSGLDITIRTGSGTGRTRISAFDHALHLAGVADFNLVTLSSVIPTGARLRHVDAPLPGGHGDLLFCVRAEAFAERPGDVAWAGLGWVTDETGGGLFVEHHGSSEDEVVGLIEASLADMRSYRRADYGPVQMALTSAECFDDPVCALALAAYRVSTWDDEPQAEAPSATYDAPYAAATHHRAPVTGSLSDLDDPTHPAGSSEPSEASVVAPSSSRLPPPPASHGSVELPVPEVCRGAVARVTIESEVDYTTARTFYRLYRASFEQLATQAVARHVLHESEFLEEMLDPRVQKYVAWDDEDVAVGLTTLTTDLETVPWISAAWFAEHYPEQYARHAIYYFGLALVHPDRQGAKVLHALLEPMTLTVVRNGGVGAWDLCGLNNDRGFARVYPQLFAQHGEVVVEPIDTQTYYAARYVGPELEEQP